MKYYAVIDTNVLVSAMLNIKSNPGLIALESLQGSVIPVLSDEILEEYNEVLRRPKFKFREERVRNLISGLRERAIFLEGIPVEEKLPDSKDVIFYEVVMEARENEKAYLVTGNLKHFPIKPYVVTPRDMLNIIAGTTENNIAK